MLNFGTVEDFDSELQKHSASLLASEVSQDLIRILRDGPTQRPSLLDELDLTHLRIPSRKLKDLEVLALLSWYMTEGIGVLLRLDLEAAWPNDFREIGEVLLVSKEMCLAWFCIQDKFNCHDFFGNYLSASRVQSLLSRLRFIRKSQRPVRRYTGYCRGHSERTRTIYREPLPPELRVGVISEEEEELRRSEFSGRLSALIRACRDFLRQNNEPRSS